MATNVYGNTIWGLSNATIHSSLTFAVWPSNTTTSWTAPASEGPVDPTKLDELRSEIVAKLTVEAQKPGFRTGDPLGPDVLNERVLELIFAVLLREGLLNTQTRANRGGEEGRINEA